METVKIVELRSRFEKLMTYFEGIEVWLASDLQIMLGYTGWHDFKKVITRAMEACVNSGEDLGDHFVELNKMVELDSGATHVVKDFMLSRYACYVLAQNGDPKKEPVAFAQGYFALKTRKYELIEERLELDERIRAREKLNDTEEKLLKSVFERGVDSPGFKRINRKGDKELFGGDPASKLKKKMGVPANRSLTDFLPTITIKAKDFAAEITNFNIGTQHIHGEKDITKEHMKNNRDVRELLKKRGIRPEELPAEEDIKKIRRRAGYIDENILEQDKKPRG